MSGLREQQKEMRRKAISKVAIELFESQGYGATTIEQIAKRAGVSPPTVFKYFGTKQEIILEMLRGADRAALTQARQDMPLFEDPLDSLCRLGEIIIAYTLRVLPAALWRELLPLILLGDIPESFKEVDRALLAEISELMGELKRDGKLRADLDTDLAAYFLNDYSYLQMLRLVNQDPPDLEAYFAKNRVITRLVFEGLRAA